MELPQETEDYIRESIDHSVGLPVSFNTLLDKLHALEAANLFLRQQYLSLQSKMKEKDEIIERARAEASMNAVALKKFVDENQKLAAECTKLLEQSNEWERECSLYEQDREALMDFANEADEKAKEAESHNQDLVEQNKKLVEELQLFKSRSEVHTKKDCEALMDFENEAYEKAKETESHNQDLVEQNKKLVEELQLFKSRSEAHTVDVPNHNLHMEQELHDSLLASMFGKDDFKTTALGFLEANSGIEVCQKILKMWSSLRPEIQKIVAMVAEIKNLEKDKDNLAVNLSRAEEEANVLFEEYNKLDEANKRLILQCCREMHLSASDGKCKSSACGKGKRKSSPKMSSPLEKKLDSSDAYSQRQPLSPLQPHSPESRIHKK